MALGGLCTSSAQIELSSSTLGLVPEGVIHRVYVNLPAGASVQSIYADDGVPLALNAPGGIFQSDGLALLQAGGSMDDMDSWWTIGEPVGPNEVQQVGGDDWESAMSEFASGGGFHVDDAFGGAFFLLPFSTQGVESDGQVLLGQFISPDSVSIDLNIQWKAGPGMPAQYAEGLHVTLIPSGWGCTDSSALNYDALAEYDNGTCTWDVGAFTGLVYELTAASDTSWSPTYRIYAQVENPDEGISRYFGTTEFPLSLTSSTSFEHVASGGFLNPGLGGDALVQERDSWMGLGDVSTLLVAGLSETSFENGGDLFSDPEFGGAIVAMPGTGIGMPDEAGRVLLAQVTTSGQVMFETNITLVMADGTTQDFYGASLVIPGLIPGCTDIEACNFEASATDDDGTCIFEDALGNCGGDCLSDADADGVCDSDEVMGCTDPAALNFDVLATEDDGSCIPDVPLEADSSGFLGLAQELWLSENGLDVYRVYAEFEGSGYELVSIFGAEEAPLSLQAAEGFYQSEDAGPLAVDLPSVPSPSSELDSWLTIGGDAAGSISLLSVGIDFGPWEAGGDLLVDNAAGGAIFIIPGTQAAAVSDASGRVLIAQLASTSSMNLALNLKFIRPDGSSPSVFGLELEIPPAQFGCTDSTACNWNALATLDDGTCTHPAPFYGCDGSCLSDADGDGICDELEYEGCLDTTACNFDAFVDSVNSAPESCLFPVDIYGTTHVDCAGVCDFDEDDDGVCDSDEVSGCTYSPACNFDPQASEEDGSCIFPDAGRDCNGQCLFDFNGDGICDVPGTGGCTYPSALNYDAAAPYDDGSCEFATGNCRFDSNGDGAVNVTDLLDMLVALGTYCPE